MAKTFPPDQKNTNTNFWALENGHICQKCSLFWYKKMELRATESKNDTTFSCQHLPKPFWAVFFFKKVISLVGEPIFMKRVLCLMQSIIIGHNKGKHENTIVETFQTFDRSDKVR